MTKSYLLTAMAFLCVSVSFGQPARDSVPDQMQASHTDELLFSEFTCVVKNTNSVRVQWKSVYSADGDYFIVERSNDESVYETVSALKITDTATRYELMDNSPLNGTFFYRIKYVNKAGQIIYSKPAQVSLSADVDFKFYPNPADKLLIIRTTHNIDVEIRDAVGTLRLSKQLQPGLQVVNVSLLEKGIYVLKIADKESNRVISQQLLKN